MNNPEKTKTTSLRLTPETIEKLKEVTQQIGSTQDETMQQLIQAFELQNGINNIPNRAYEIETFRMKSLELVEMYTQSLKIWAETEEHAKAKVRLQLESKDQIIMELQEKLKESEKNAMTSYEALNKALSQKNHVEKELESAKQQLEMQQRIIDTFHVLKNENIKRQEQSNSN